MREAKNKCTIQNINTAQSKTTGRHKYTKRFCCFALPRVGTNVLADIWSARDAKRQLWPCLAGVCFESLSCVFSSRSTSQKHVLFVDARRLVLWLITCCVCASESKTHMLVTSQVKVRATQEEATGKGFSIHVHAFLSPISSSRTTKAQSFPLPLTLIIIRKQEHSPTPALNQGTVHAHNVLHLVGQGPHHALHAHFSDLAGDDPTTLYRGPQLRRDPAHLH